jgi:predicted nucleotidyltransferase
MNYSLADALFGKTKKAVIGILFSKPDISVHLRELARMAAVSAPMMQRELAILVDAGIITSRKDGNRIAFKANDACPIFEELSGIARKTIGVADSIKSALRGKDIELAFIFGSIATGKENADSDIDLMVVGDIDNIELNGLIAPLEDSLRRPIHISHYRTQEWTEINKDRLINKIVNGPKIILISNESLGDVKVIADFLPPPVELSFSKLPRPTPESLEKRPEDQLSTS